MYLPSPEQAFVMVKVEKSTRRDCVLLKAVECFPGKLNTIHKPFTGFLSDFGQVAVVKATESCLLT